MRTTKVLAAPAAGDRFHNRSIEQRTTDPIEQLYLDQVPAHMSLLVFHPSQFDGLRLGHAFSAGDSSSRCYPSQSPQFAILYQVSFSFVLCPFAVLNCREIIDAQYGSKALMTSMNMFSFLDCSQS